MHTSLPSDIHKYVQVALLCICQVLRSTFYVSESMFYGMMTFYVLGATSEFYGLHLRPTFYILRSTFYVCFSQRMMLSKEFSTIEKYLRCLSCDVTILAMMTVFIWLQPSKYVL